MGPTRLAGRLFGSCAFADQGARCLTFGYLGMKEWKRNGNYYNGLYRDYYKDPFLHS